MNDNKKREHRRNIILFFAILPLFIVTVSPFFIILKIAFTPEGITTANNYELILWQPEINDPHDGWTFEQCVMSAKVIKTDSDKQFDLSLNFTPSGGNAKWILPLKQNILNFDRMELKIDSSIPSFYLGFVDIYGNQTSKVITVKSSTNKNQVISIPLKKFKLSNINTSNVSNVYFAFNSAGEQYLKLGKISLVYKFFTLANFKEVLLTASFGRYFFNSALISIIVTLGNILLSTMAGFAFSWKSYPLRRFLFISTLIMIMIPMQLFMVPLFILVQRFGWLNSYNALIIPFLISPINIFLMKQFISKIPKDFAEVALIDGASYFQVFFRIIFPMCKPAITVVGINTFVGTWNSFLYPFIFTNTVEMRTLPVGLALYIGLFDVDWAHLMSASAISALPVLILFLCFQKYIITGMLSGTAYQN